MGQIFDSHGITAQSALNARVKVLVTQIQLALSANSGTSGWQDISRVIKNQQESRDQEFSDCWDDPLAFIRAEEPDDAEWFHDDSIDAGAKPAGVSSNPAPESQPQQQPTGKAEAEDALDLPAVQMWSTEVFDDPEDLSMDWSDEEDPPIDVAEFEAMPADFFDVEFDENAPDWSQRFGIAHQDIVREVAIGIALKVGWNEIGADAIARALFPYRTFGKVRADLEQFILGKRVSVRELLLVTGLRSVWLEGGYCRGWSYRGNQFGTRPIDWKINLDWWLGLRMVRGLRTDDLEEVRLFLDDCFEEWTHLSSACTDIDLALMDHDSSERGAMLHFHLYLHLILERMISWPDSRRFPSFVDYRLFPREEGIRDCSMHGMDPLAELFFDD